tara:strand:- start:659 stop:916 length:258 start_codon:yes stop_codon:yes gene_type:complete
MKHLVRDLRFLLSRAEEKIWMRADRVLLSLYWEIGYRMRQVDESRLPFLSSQLGKQLDVQARLFEVSYYFYRDNPIKQKAVEVAA